MMGEEWTTLDVLSGSLLRIWDVQNLRKYSVAPPHVL